MDSDCETMLCKGKKEYDIKMVEDGKELQVCESCAKNYERRNPKPEIKKINPAEFD